MLPFAGVGGSARTRVIVVVVVVAFGISDLAAAEWSSCSNQLGWSSRLDAGARARGLMAI